MDKTKFFEESPRNNSIMRVMVFIYFIASIPIDFIIIMGSMQKLNTDKMTWEETIFAVSIFLIVNVVWIAPKCVQKVIEGKGVLGKMIEKK